MSPTIKCMLISATFLCYPVIATAQTPVPAISASESGNIISTAGPLVTSNNETRVSVLLHKEAALEEALNQLESNGPWDIQLSESLLELAQVRQDLGNKEAARQVYNRLLLNLRVNQGLYSANQIPIILDLMKWYLEEAEYQLADELGDWAEFLYQRIYAEENEVELLFAAYNELINIRLGAPQTHTCYTLNLRIEDYDQRDFSCGVIRRFRSEHFISAFQLQKKRVELVAQMQGADQRLIQQKTRLAKISVVTAGVVGGIAIDPMQGFDGNRRWGISGDSDEVITTFRGIGNLRRRYDPEYYYLTTFRLVRQLQKDYPQLAVEK